ncbi:hypothetical protein H4S07_006994 [Coemansia furcata]|uniref:Uncharacterized protein n=1 Tax=Coemansia furcata TaxID=417177 RepID=A0ACC1KS64_9FUNG|nr:hypothetical protein H4S07_006994 [Coemansia furcata]
MTMEESAGLHAWIKHGLAAAAAGDDALVGDDDDGRGIGAQEEGAEMPLPASSSSLAVVRNPPHRANRQRDYAMLYCPSMQHVLLGGDVEDGGIGAAYKPGAPRVIHAERRTLDDVDDSVPPLVSSRVVAGSADLLVPTQASGNLLLQPPPRPKMSLYSPVVARGNGGLGEDDIRAPWEEYANVDPAAGGGSRQKYLRIDVEVVGSRWVTADKFASGLY